jgi:phosphoglycolate phosphatase
MTPPGRRFDLVILDFDGTLADSWPWLLGALDETALRFGLHRLTHAEAEALRGQDHRAALRALGVRPWQVPRIAMHLRRLAASAPPPPLFPGIPALLQGLHARGATLAVASSNSAGQIARTLGPALSGLIAHVAADAPLSGKPGRFRRILRASAIPAARAIALGDELRDIEAARACGLTAAAVAWGYARPALLAASRPDMVFQAPEDALAALGG